MHFRMVMWMSGLNQRFAKPSVHESGPVSSNLTVTTNYGRSYKPSRLNPILYAKKLIERTIMNTKFLNMVKKHMLNQQYTFLNSGTYGAAFKKANTVVKVILKNDAEGIGTCKVQDEYVKYCFSKNNIHLPKFEYPKDDVVGGKLKVRVYPMELLKEVDDETAAMLDYVSNSVVNGSPLKTEWSYLTKEYSPNEFSTKNRILITDFNKFELKFESLHAAMEDVKRSGTQKGYDIDFIGNNYVNILQRTNGTLVILDPWAY